MKVSKIIVLLMITLFTMYSLKAQQDPHYTQYMFNTMSINPAYTGSKGHFTASALGRTQWVGIDGAPDTQNFSFHTPLGYSGVGLGFNFVNDELGPAKETYFDGNISYTLRTSDKSQFAFGLRFGGRTLNLDWSKGSFQNTDVLFNENVDKFLPTVGAGIYFHTPKGYIGFSIPNFLRTEHYNDLVVALEVERLHYFLIAGYVFDLSDSVKFKPATIAKIVDGAPLSIDVSANFLFNEKFNLGVAYRWDDSVSAIVGFQISDSLNIGYAYDLTTSNYKNYNFGTHEVMLTFDILRQATLKSPRFF
ncbi:type IX secretion system membrane protein PorP/SprF [uncultured Polaribacter sp.]|uniref:PorP/SprF family type IX secretion system membrane protein n=1 Tax=uncultured Polaribacter sp. TaxID=174711 RepID=UPI0026027603|nr:type IX secretion system membrane protein PorP/SprF [uncultured Polaribacter sp.]